MGDVGELEAELIKRNREIAKVRDDALKLERRLEDAQMRNDDLLERVAELDAEKNQGMTKITELEEKLQAVESERDARAEEALRAQEAAEERLESVRAEMEEKAAAAAQDNETTRSLEAKVAELEAEKAALEQKLNEEQLRHGDTRVRLEKSEREAQDHSSRSTEQRRIVKELEEKLQEQQEGMSNTASLQLEEERARAAAELHRATALMEEHRSVRGDLERQVHEREVEEAKAKAELEDLRRDLSNHTGTVEDIEALKTSHQEAMDQLKATHDEVLNEERKRAEEHLSKATRRSAELDGKLDSQRDLLREANKSLRNSEALVEQLRAQLAEKEAQLDAQGTTARSELEAALAKAQEDLESSKARFAQELESAEVMAKNAAATEVDAANRRAAEAEEREKRLEGRLSAMQEDNTEAQSAHSRAMELQKTQLAELRQRLLEVEERSQGHQQEGDRLKKDLEESKNELERAQMAHKQEQERFQQTLEAKDQSTRSSERVLQSQLEEKDTLLEHRDASVRNLEQDLEEARKKAAELEESVAKASEEGESKAHLAGVRNAQLEGELRRRQDRLNEVEGRLDAQRQYLEQVQSTLGQEREDKEKILQLKGSLEAQLQLESTHKEAVSESLQRAQEDSERRVKELEQRILEDRDAHRETIEEVRRSMQDELKLASEKCGALEAELTTARQRCELLMRTKADLQAELGEHSEKYKGLEAKISEHRAASEQLGLELEQERTGRSTVEDAHAKLSEEKRASDARIAELEAEVRDAELRSSSQLSDFGAKVQKLDELLDGERRTREEAEQNLVAIRQEHDNRARELDQDRKRTEQELTSLVDSWREKAEETQAQLSQAREQLEAQRAKGDDLEDRRREVEAKLRSESETLEARLRRAESEAQRAQGAIEDSRAVLAEQQNAWQAKISAVERQLEQETTTRRSIQTAKEAAEASVLKQKDGMTQMGERLSMSVEELFTRQVDFALEKNRISGALEESRRTLRNSLGVPNPVAAVDSVRISSLEVQLSEERRKNIEQVVALQRAERKCTQLDEKQKSLEEQRSNAVHGQREAERKVATLEEDLRKASMEQTRLEAKSRELDERTKMSTAEIGTVKYSASYEVQKLRGALDELRHCLTKGPAPGTFNPPARV